MNYNRDYPNILKILQFLRQESTFILLDVYSKESLDLHDDDLIDSYANFFVENKLTYTATNYLLSQKVLQYGKDISNKELKKLVREGNIDERIAKLQERELKGKVKWGILGALGGFIISNIRDILSAIQKLLH
jgi:hypothetical protein